MNPMHKSGSFMLVKFGKKEYMNELHSGIIYMKNLKYYVELEKSTGDENTGDRYEASLVTNNATVMLTNLETQERAVLKNAEIVQTNVNCLYCPTYCMCMLGNDNLISDSSKKGYIPDGGTVQYTFTDEQRAKLLGFGDTAVLFTDTDEFLKRLSKALIAHGIEYDCGPMNYAFTNQAEQARSFHEGGVAPAFWKRQKYEYQREYRIVLKKQVEDHFSIDIGDLSDISELCDSEFLLHSNIGYTPLTI